MSAVSRPLLLVLCFLLAAGGMSALADEPVAVLRLAGVDRVLADVDAVSEYTARPLISRFVGNLMGIANNLQGFDRGRPLAVEILLSETPGREPSFRVILPIVDAAMVETTLNRVGLELVAVDEDESPRRLRKKGGNGDSPLFVEFRDNVLVAATDRNAFVSPLLPEPASVTLSDLSLTIHADRIPRLYKQEILEQLRADIARDRERKEDESATDHALRVEATAIIEQMLTLFVDESVTLSAAFDLLPTSPADGGEFGLAVSAHWGGLPEGVLARQLQHLPTSQRYLASTGASNAALRLHAAAMLPPRFRDFLDAVVRAGRKAAEAELRSAPPDQRDVLLSLFNAFDASLQARHGEALVQFVPVDDRMVLLAGAHLREGDHLARALEILLPEAARSSEIASVEMNVAEIQDIQFHRVRGTRLKSSDERLYGPAPAAFIGADEDEVWIGLGGDATLSLLSDYVNGSTREANSTRLGEFELRLRPWLPFSEEPDRNADLVRILRDVFAAEQEDQIRGHLNVVSDGLQAELYFDKPFLHVISGIVTRRMAR